MDNTQIEIEYHYITTQDVFLDASVSPVITRAAEIDFFINFLKEGQFQHDMLEFS